MTYHVEFLPPKAAIYEGPGRSEIEATHETFLAAREEAIGLLEDHLAACQGFLSDLRNANGMGDLPRYENA